MPDPYPSKLPHRDGAFALRGELRPVAGDRRVEVELTPVGEDERAQRGDRLRRREALHDRVGPERAGVRAVEVAAPQVHHGLAVDEDRDGGADVLTGVEVVPERRAHRLEPVGAGPLDLQLGDHADDVLDALHGNSSQGMWTCSTRVAVLRSAT